MTKEEKIKESWGEKFDSDVNLYKGSKIVGFNYSYNSEEYDSIKYLDCIEIRPKSLKGIEDNNGWIKIESIEDLPLEKVNCYYYDLKVNYLSDLSERENSRLKNLFELGVITHLFIVKPTPIPKPPIY